MPVQTKRWLGTQPTKCDKCDHSLTEGWFDARTVFGPWANLCGDCFTAYGVGLGTGYGQQYDNRGTKVAG